MTGVSSLIDFSDPWRPDAPRLRHGFARPRRLLVAHHLSEVRTVLDAAETAARAGAWVLGWLAYEAAAGLNPELSVQAPPKGQPLAWFGVHDGPLPWPDPTADADTATADWHSRPTRAALNHAWAAIQHDLAAGRYRLINLTALLQGQLDGPARALFAALQRAQPGGYAAHIDSGTGQQLLSVSPELLFDWRSSPDGSGPILTRPMKGTAPRSPDPATDAARAEQLRNNPTDLAQLDLAADCLQHELARIARPGSVHQPRRHQLQALPSVWQMSSDVQADSRAGTRLSEVFAALFPSASVTGSPKRAAMQAIAALEADPRGVYCGAIGLLHPDPDPQHGPGSLRARFNVPIRTLELHGQTLRCGIGSGISAGAQADAEWAEWQAKQVFIDRASTPFELIETLALERGQLRHGPEHLARLARSARHFNMPWHGDVVQACLQHQQQQHPDGSWRLRLLLDARGRARAEVQPLPPAPELPVRLVLATRPLPEVHTDWLQHKTTRRAHYAALAPVPDSGVFDTLLYNRSGEITETSFGNIAAHIEGAWVTPPVRCGLLPGVGRAVALRQGRLREAVLRLEDIPRVQAWAFINSLRGWLPARLQA